MREKPGATVNLLVISIWLTTGSGVITRLEDGDSRISCILAILGWACECNATCAWANFMSLSNFNNEVDKLITRLWHYFQPFHPRISRRAVQILKMLHRPLTCLNMFSSQSSWRGVDSALQLQAVVILIKRSIYPTISMLIFVFWTMDC